MNRSDKYCNSCIHFKLQKFNTGGFCHKIYEHNVVVILREDKNKLITEIIDAGVPQGGWRVDCVVQYSPEYSDKEAKDFFDTLTKSYQQGYCDWVGSAKQEATRTTRAEKALLMLKNKQKTLKTV